MKKTITAADIAATRASLRQRALDVVQALAADAEVPQGEFESALLTLGQAFDTELSMARLRLRLPVLEAEIPALDSEQRRLDAEAMAADQSYRKLEADSERERKTLLEKASEGVRAAWAARSAAVKARQAARAEVEGVRGELAALEGKV